MTASPGTVRDAQDAMPGSTLAGPDGALAPLRNLFALAHPPGMAYAVLVAADVHELARAPGLPLAPPPVTPPASAADWTGEQDLPMASGTTLVHEFHCPSAGRCFSRVNNNIQACLSALNFKGRGRTLSTPRLLALENQEATTNAEGSAPR